MIYGDVKSQLDGVFNRTIETGVSFVQHFPSTKITGSGKSIGDLKSTAIALRNISYKLIYKELDENDQFHIKLPDGGLMLFQYEFGQDDKLTKHRLAYFPSPKLPTVEEAPELYASDEIYGDILLDQIVRFPVRFDFDPRNYKPVFHPHSHLTLGQYENCRIPVSSALTPINFLRFILRNFYHRLYKKHMNKFEMRLNRCEATRCITENEKSLLHMAI